MPQQHDSHAQVDPVTRSSTVPARSHLDPQLVSMLDLLAQTIVDALGFGVACMNIVRSDGSLEVVSVAGDPTARDALLGAVDSGENWENLLAVSEAWGRLRFADHRNEAAELDMLMWVPDVEPSDDEDAWHPEDALFAPLTASDGELIGVLSVDMPHDGRRPSLTGRSALEAFAVSAALAIEHSTLRLRAEAAERALAHRASHDPLTGVGNRVKLTDRLEHALAARPAVRPLMALTFIDLDGFKAINDQFSHAAGDRVLEVVAGRISSVVRPHDTVARWGGDEFLVLLERLGDDADGLDIARRIWSVVSAPIGWRGRELRVTCSSGIAFCRPTEEVDAEELLRRADGAMYDVKHSGRNGVAIFSGQQHTAPQDG
jgi:diguanylate cyclase (GGDEF)-like protein